MSSGNQRGGTRSAVTSDAALPTSFGRYAVEALLGRGGVGAVYRALDHASGARVALKTLELKSARALELFELEYQTLAAIEHPAVVRTFDYGVTDNGTRYYTMELIEGEDLYALMPLPWPALCVHLRTVAEALSLLHARQLVHRDVSPRNIRIDRRGQARLLDFGALARFGAVTDVVGTPACISPEAVNRGVIDGRSDLFSLGATAYIALSGSKPYSLTSLDDARTAFTVAPRSLLESLPELPLALNDLIMRLLQTRPERRPDSAADVIEHLNAIVDARAERDSDPAPKQLFSPLLIGRERETQQLREHLADVLKGHGTALVIEGASGIGKSRLIEQLLIDARVLGAAAVRAEGGSNQLFAGAHYQLMRGLLAAAPADVQASLTAQPLAAAWYEAGPREASGRQVMGARFDATGPHLGAVVRSIQILSERRVLVLVVEDAHALDADSAAVLIGLAHSLDTRRIMLVLTLDADAGLDPNVERIVRLCSQIKLRTLDSSAIDALVTSIFGQVDHRARLSRWLESMAGGNPGHSLELLDALVRKGIVRRLSGSWSIPRELPQQQLPASLEDALVGVLSSLDARALDLARLMALHSGSMPLSLCQELRKGSTEQEVRALCDDLVAERVVSVGAAGYRIAHEGWRKALLSAVDSAGRVELHRALAEALLTEAEQRESSRLGARLQAGWHLLHGGEVERGRELLRTTGISLTRHGEGLAEAVPALESALEAYGEDSRTRWERLSVTIPLTAAGTYLDWRLTYKYGPAIIDGLSEAAGIDLASTLAKFLPGRVALLASIGFAAVRVPLTARRMVARDYRELFLGLIGLSTMVLGTYCSLSDAAGAERLIQRLQPLGWFPRRHAAAIAHRFQRALAELAAGRYADALQQGRDVLALIESPDAVRGMPDDARRQFVVGLHILIGSIEVYRSDQRLMESISALERAGTPAALESVAGFRANYHANRGEMKQYRMAREALDVLAARGGSPWRQDVLMPRCLWWVQAQCEDALGLKRSIRQLEQICRECEGLASTYAAAHGCYLADRGLATEALERYGPTLAAAVTNGPILSARLAGAYARMLRKGGQAQAALDVCKGMLARFSRAESELVCLVHGVDLELGLALAGVGQLQAAADHLDRLCRAQNEHDNPLLHALSHIACAEVALLQRNREALLDHGAQAERWVASTQYAALFGLVQRLHGRTRAAGLGPEVIAADSPERTNDDSAKSIQGAIAACRGDAERQQVALDILIEHTRTAGGYLYVAARSGLRFVAPQDGAEPPDALLSELEERMRDFRALNDDASVTQALDPLDTVVGDDAQRDAIAGFEAKVGSRYHIVMLTLPNARLVGVAALVVGMHPPRAIARAIGEAVAQGIYQAGDATIMR